MYVVKVLAGAPERLEEYYFDSLELIKESIRITWAKVWIKDNVQIIDNNTPGDPSCLDVVVAGKVVLTVEHYKSPEPLTQAVHF